MVLHNQELENDLLFIINKTRMLLTQNTEWQTRYKQYAADIIRNKESIKKAYESLKIWEPLKMYTNTGYLKEKDKVSFDLRYLGQTVAKLTVIKENRTILNTTYGKKGEDTNLRYFGCGIHLWNADCNGKEAEDFHQFFKSEPERNPNQLGPKIEEHRLESMLITELSKEGRQVLSNLNPIMIEGVRYAMTTAISASKPDNIKYQKIGGGIDILTRTSGKDPKLCIIELKKKYKNRKAPQQALKQAVAYTTFIRELLRSDTGTEWWNLFGFNGEVPKQLVLYAACAMPSSANIDKSFEDMSLDIDGDIIRLQYLYFVEEDNRIINVDTSL